MHFEGPYLSVEKRLHRSEYIREITEEMKSFICENADVIIKLTLAAENPTARYIKDFTEKGIIISLGHSNANYDLAESNFGRC